MRLLPMWSRILSGKASQIGRQNAMIAMGCFLLAWGIFIALFVPPSQTIEVRPLNSGDSAINPTMNLLYFCLLGVILIIALSLLRRPLRGFFLFIFCIAVLAFGNYVKSTLNVALDRSMPKLMNANLISISYLGSKKYGKTLQASIESANGQSLRISTRYAPHLNLVEVKDSKVVFYLCGGYFGEPYICSGRASN